MNPWRLLALFAIALAIAVPSHADGRNPGSVLVFPVQASGFGPNGDAAFTIVSVTNTNATKVVGHTNVLYQYVNVVPGPLPGSVSDCLIIDRTEALTPADTLSVLTACHNGPQAQGYLVVAAQDPTLVKSSWSFNHLVGSQLVFTALGGHYSINAIPFSSPQVERLPTDLDVDGQLDFDGAEYEGVPTTLHLDGFLALPGSSLALVNLTGGTNFDAVAKFDLWNDNEQALSLTTTVRCWKQESLGSLSPLFSHAFLVANTPHDPDELDLNCDGVGDLETGWARLDGLVAFSDAQTVVDPALLAAVTDGPGGPIDGGRLFWEAATQQYNGDVLKFGVSDPEDPFVCEPELTLTLTCQESSPLATEVAVSGTLANTGNVPVWGLAVESLLLSSTLGESADATFSIGAEQILVGESTAFSAVIQTNQLLAQGPGTLAASISATVPPTCGDSIVAQASVECPVVCTPVLDVTLECLPLADDLSVPAMFAGTITNNGDAPISNITAMVMLDGSTLGVLQEVDPVDTLNPGQSMSLGGTWASGGPDPLLSIVVTGSPASFCGLPDLEVTRESTCTTPCADGFAPFCTVCVTITSQDIPNDFFLTCDHDFASGTDQSCSDAPASFALGHSVDIGTSSSASVAVDFSASSCGGGGPFTYLWDFGNPDDDLAFGTTEDETYVYTDPGIYPVTLTVMSDSGACRVYHREVRINQMSFVDDIQIISMTPTTDGMEVVYQAEGSDPDGTIASYCWDFGDGETTTIDVAAAMLEGDDPRQSTHTYSESGAANITIKVGVVDDDGLANGNEAFLPNVDIPATE